MKQDVYYISVRDLVLWTENPRDPVDLKADDQDIVNRALEDRQFKWSLSKLAREMGDYYDYSELPTVVYEGGRPVVFDGNRRIILAKIKLGIVAVPKGFNLKLPSVEDELPCNVCDRKVALANVYRKHSESGSWQPLERDIFLYKFMGEEKSSFLILEEDTGIITANPHLNKRFVKEEVFKGDSLKQLGFSIKSGKLRSIHSDVDAKKIFLDLSRKIASGDLNTRNNRGKVVEILDPELQRLIDHNRSNKLHSSKIRFDTSKKVDKSKNLSRRSTRIVRQLFGGKLYLQKGYVSDLYRDISDLYEFYNSRKDKLSPSFPGIIRMSLRLLCETAAKECKKPVDFYLKDNFDAAKKLLDQDIKTTLSGQNVAKESMMQLLHTGAHSYQSTSNLDQTIALSIAVGAILTVSHGRSE